MNKQLTNDAPASFASGSIAAWAGALAVGIVLVLVAQFLLDSFADSSTIGHWMQHAALFLGGGLVGASVLRLYQLGGRAA